MKAERDVGKAYGFFYSSAPEKEIEKHIPDARARALTPDTLDLKFHQGINPAEFRGDSELSELAGTAIAQANNYTISATFHSATSKRTARELGDVLNALYQSPLQKKFERAGKYLGGIVYKQDGRYEFAE